MTHNADDVAPVQPPPPPTRPGREQAAKDCFARPTDKAVVAPELISAGVTQGRTVREVRRAEEQLTSRWADAAVIAELRTDGFAGPRYDRFAEDLSRYGLGVMQGWLHSGHAFKVTASRGYPLYPTEEELEEFALQHEAREQVAVMTVVKALPSFRQRALLGAGWTPEGGASITTYFMGACAYTLPGEIRARRAQRVRWAQQNQVDAELTTVRNSRAVTDAAVLATGNMWVRDVLARASDGAQPTLALTLDGYSQEEIAELLGLSSERAVEGRLHRWRQAERGML